MPSLSGDVYSTLSDWIWQFVRIFDPRSGFIYQKSVVHGNQGHPALAFFDLPPLEKYITESNYKSLNSPGVYQHRWFRVTLQLTVETDSEPKSPHIREEIIIPGGFSIALVAAILSVFLWIYLPALLGTALLVGSASIFMFLLCGFLIIPSPLARYLDELRSTNQTAEISKYGPQMTEPYQNIDPEDVAGHTTLDIQSYRASCIGPPMTALLGGFAASGPVFISGMPFLLQVIEASPYVNLTMFDTWFVVPFLGAMWMLGFWILGLLLGGFIYAFESEETQIQVFPFDLVSRIPNPIPELTGGYFSILGVAGIPLIALSNSYFLLPAVYRLSPARQWVYFLFPAIIMISSLPVFIYWWIVQNREYVYGQTIKKLSRLSSPRSRITVAIIATSGSYLVSYSFLTVIEKYWSYLGGPIIHKNPLPILENPILVGILMASLIPALYFFAGVAYQSISHVILVAIAIIRSDPVGRSPHLDHVVRILPETEIRAFTLAIGPWKCIFVSTGLYNQLSTRREFAALLAHEEGHLTTSNRYISDAQLGTLLPIIGLLTLTGKNILYALANYREREISADDYAVAQVGEEPLIDALEAVGSASPSHVSGSPFAPIPHIHTPGPLSRPTTPIQGLERYFGLLFGSFALTKAHPSMNERIQQISNCSENG